MTKMMCSIVGGILLVLLSSCRQNPVTPVPLMGNLIENPTFQVHGQPSLQSWVYDSSLAKIVQDAPAEDGTWSLELNPGWLPQEGFAQTYVSGQLGEGVYQLTVWMKSVDKWKGSVSLGRWSDNQWLSRKSVSSDSTQWSSVSIIDTISLSADDTIAVHLSAGATEVAYGDVLFDDIALVRLK